MAPDLRPIGSLLQANPARLLLALTACLLLLSVAIRSAKLDGRLASWLQRDSQLGDQLEQANAALAEGAGSTGQLLLQTPRKEGTDVLSVEALMVHLEALAVATHVTVDLFDVSWSLKDLCFTPTLPDYDGLHVTLALENMMPCFIRTPLDCFWEGAKLHGPEQPVSMGAMGPMLKWTSLNPIPMIEALHRNHPHASFPYPTLLTWMRRVGITSGYQMKPCLDPSDPNCPDTAPNKLSNQAPVVGATITGGCHGVASAQMHWREEEIVAGIERNKSGLITKAQALQSTIELMGEQDMYDYWRKTSKVQDINNWSAEKARLILESWQRRFTEELAHFARTSSASAAFKIHTITSRSTVEPMNVYSLLDLTNLEYCFILMTIFTCIAYPPFELAKSHTINSLKCVVLAIVTSSAVGLSLVASLGLASFMDLPFNMATLQILPPLALLLGFNQNFTVAKVFSRRLKQQSRPEQLTADCLYEILPLITIESLVHMVAFGVAAIIPIAATRAFALQAIIHIFVSTLSTLLLIPSIIITFISCRPTNKIDTHDELMQERPGKFFKPRSNSPFQFSSRSDQKSSLNDAKTDNTSIEDQIFSRLQDDLKNIRADSHQPTNIDLSVRLDTDEFTTSFKLTTSCPRTRHGASTPITTSLNSNIMKTETSTKPALPDLIASITPKPPTDDAVAPRSSVDGATLSKLPEDEVTTNKNSLGSNFLDKLIHNLATNRLTHATVCVMKIFALIAMISQITNIRYGLRLTDILARGTVEHESLYLQEKYFPIYNVFAITKGNFDYPSNQKLLHEYYRALESVDGTVQSGSHERHKFWLINFRDWLQELQQSFDIDRNKSAISVEGWTEEASDFSKLAYKLLAQTGKTDNPIDKSHVVTNRLVDSKGIINQRAFYYYLAAWVINDPFTYATSEANLKPEPKIWNYNQDDLRIEKARPIMYAQIPFLLKLPVTHDILKTISEMRRISQTFEGFNLPNLLTGVPFTYWNQFFNLEILMTIAATLGLIAVFTITALLLSDTKMAAMVTLPMATTLLELYCFLGVSSVQLNNVLAVLLLSNIGFASTNSLQYILVSSYYSSL